MSALLLALFLPVIAFAQNINVSGTVIDELDMPVISATVIVVGQSNMGAITDLDGNFTINGVPSNATLRVSYVGYKTQEIALNGRTNVTIKLVPDSELLDEVVVTALGIKRESKSLAYSAQTVGGKEVNEIKSVNLINSLQGKSAGLSITPNSSGAGGASKIQFRGSKSINGNNQPLVVVDGVPLMMNIDGGQASGNYGGGHDGGDALSMINPDDIAQITLLKGASAAALYGAVAANGAIMITTKSGYSGKVSINFSSNTTAEMPLTLPQFQTTYGVSDNGTYSWGNKLSAAAENYAQDYYQTGFTTNNSVSLSGGTDKVTAYFSYGNVYSNGITPLNTFNSHNLMTKVGFKVFENVSADFSASYNRQDLENQPVSGFIQNPLLGVYLFPRGEDWNGYKTNFEVYDAARNINVHNWVNTTLEQFSNPYWVLNRQKPVTQRNRYDFGGQLRWDILPGLFIQGRLRYERGDDHTTKNEYATSEGNRFPYGNMRDARVFSEQLYGDLLASYNHTWGDFLFAATVGGSFTQTQSSGLGLIGWGQSLFSITDGKPSGGVYFPNLFIPGNYYQPTISPSLTKKRLNALFGTAEFGYKDGLFLDVTARNDWSSALAFTPNVSFFYPSVGLSLLLDKFVNMGPNVDMFKLRGSYSVVGNDVPVYLTNILYTLSGNGGVTAPSQAPFTTLKPEMTSSMEFGFEGQFFDRRLGLDLTYYKTNTRNQFFTTAAPYPSGLRGRYVNAGDVENQGVEFTASWYQPINSDWTWTTQLNLAYNTNKINELVDGLSDGLALANYGNAQMVLKEGGEYGDLYVRQLKRDANGKPEVGDNGAPVLDSDNIKNYKYVGNMNAKWNAGWTNTITYKDIQLSFLIDGKFGGKVLSLTEATLDGWGVSKRSGDARDAGKVVLDGATFDPVTFYKAVGATNFNSQYAAELYVYDATNIRLRELSLGYTFRDLFGNGKNLTASLIGRNLFFFYKDAPMDPDVSIGTGNGWQGFDAFVIPTTRSIGLNLKLNF